MSDARRIEELLRQRVADLAAFLFPNGYREGNHWRVGSIEGEPGKSFDICTSGSKAGLWGDFAGQEKHSRSLLKLWMRARNVDFKTALREAAEWLGEPLNPAKKPASARKSRATFRTLDDAVRFMERKLKMRKTRCDDYHDADGNVHFVVGRFDGEPRSDGKKNKEYRPFYRSESGWVIADPAGKLPLFHLRKLLVPPLNSTNPLDEFVFVVEGEKCVCELETLDLLATTSAHGAKGARITDWEPLAGRKVVILPDKGAESYADVVTSLLLRLSPQAKVRTVKLPGLEPKEDCVDWLDKRDGQTPEDIKAELLALIKNSERENGSQLSFRTPDEILAMPRNQLANFLGDHLLGIALSLVLAGIGGIGKSRLFLQLLVAFILERLWCGMETHHTKDKPWMLIQTQNPILRLQDDLESLRKYAGNDWSLVDKNLIIHTLETDRDLMLHLSDQRNARDLESVIRDYNPIGVAFDPLNDFAIGDISKDVDMMTTCREIGRISRAGNPERAILISTHALTGLAGMKKAFGFEAAGFGRNSKVLQTWARAFMNVIPATEDYAILVLTCGKNNNGKMFEPVAVRLNQDTMLYEPEPDFDISAFREQIESAKKRRTFTDKPQIVAEIEWRNHKGEVVSELDKKGLASSIIDETGCSQSTAYRLIDAAATQRIIKFSKLTQIYAKK